MSENEEKSLTEGQINEILSKALKSEFNLKDLFDILKEYGFNSDEENTELTSDENKIIEKRFRYRKNRRNRYDRGEIYRYG